MPCSLCKKTGHNKTTCQRKFSTDSIVSNPSNGYQEINKLLSVESDESLSKTGKCSKPKSKISTVETNKKSNEIGNSDKSNKTKINRTSAVVNRENVSDKPLVNTVKYSSNVNSAPKIHRAQIDKKSTENINIDKNKSASNSEALRVNRADNDKKFVSPKHDPSTNKKVNPTNDYESPANSSSRLAQPKACAPELKLNEPKSANKPVKKNWKDIKVEDGDKDILCHSAMERFFEGPTKDDGEGYIYTYTYEGNKTVTAKQQSTFKVGMTKNLPERRIQVLAHDNHEKYVKIHSQKVTWRRLAENLIHKQLTANGHHCPRKDVKGECMHVTSEEGGYTYKKNPKQMLPQIRKEFELIESGTPEMTVCGLYVVTDPDKIVEITIRYMNVNCESGGLMAFVDGWELNGQYFPGVEDHELNLDKRIIEFCNDNKHWPLKQFHRVYRSSQNAALLQYRIPIRGQFVATVRFIHNPNPCNIMAGEVSPIYNLINVGKRNNCTLTALYPAVVSIKNVNVGGTEQHLSYDCEQNKQDRIVVGGSNGLDSSNMEKSSSVCGHSEKTGPEQGIFCGVTSVRLSSSGNYVNTAVVSIRPADESDIAIATLVC